jgi:hypothetical protein
VVVAVGLTLAEPFGKVDVNDPGVMEMLVAPVAAQLSLLLVPALMLAGTATKDVIAGTVTFPVELPDEPTEPQPTRPTQTYIVRTMAQRGSPESWSPRKLSSFPKNDLGKPMRRPSVVAGHTSLISRDSGAYWPQVQKQTAGPRLTTARNSGTRVP